MFLIVRYDNGPAFVVEQLNNDIKTNAINAGHRIFEMYSQP